MGYSDLIDKLLDTRIDEGMILCLSFIFNWWYDGIF